MATWSLRILRTRDDCFRYALTILRWLIEPSASVGKAERRRVKLLSTFLILFSINILVIEDDPASLRLTQYILEHKGYEVLTAVNGLDGLKKAWSEGPDLVTLDVMLPGIGGFDVCYQLRAEPQTAKMPILMLSAGAREVDMHTGRRVGTGNYITKPVDPAEIISSIEVLLKRGERKLPV